ncbi:CCA tRNA nucleotidyltransferase [Sandaracinobacteroides saxicola]|uniref:CCA tRNA nucleotidyltransferase n=1 Tax=Sandaracinobacteroides saxicola TaxID=2759707 RepID=A0A7G5IDN7_9SPHN|nr:CCA tRNA nucleotidyltransferase [Sandaracinobacteroides saxicola]QMW21479.1 CCA tRNA nucleotidyltransferase [Sandaracinobacteroides saxicola]
MILDPARWAAIPGLPAVLAALPDARIVGGAVRDALMDLPLSDVDLATALPPKEVIAHLESAGLKAVPTGLKHGTITAVSAGHPFEVTTLRHDLRTDGRHAEVAFTNDWQADAARRDFTINALYADPVTGDITDWFGGLEDISLARVRFIGEPLRRIAEDHLRILRFFRFTARFARRVDPAGLAACSARANDLMALSRERIRDELLKILALPAPVATLATMLDHGILRPVLPEIRAETLPALTALIAAEATVGLPADPLRRLAALLPADATIVDDISARLKLSNTDRVRMGHAASRAPVAADPRATAYALGTTSTLDRLLLTADPRAAAWAPRLASWRKPRLPLSGKDLIAMGLSPGPIVSAKLADVERRWIAAGFPSDRETTAAIARQVLGLA